jgi:hypothetical protein
MRTGPRTGTTDSTQSFLRDRLSPSLRRGSGKRNGHVGLGGFAPSLTESNPGTPERDKQLLADAIARAKTVLLDELRKDPEAIAGPLDGAILSAIVNMETNREIASHSKNLVRLTRALLVATAVLGVLTAVLLWRTLV